MVGFGEKASCGETVVQNAKNGKWTATFSRKIPRFFRRPFPRTTAPFTLLWRFLSFFWGGGSELFYSILLSNPRPPEWRFYHKLPQKLPKSSADNRDRKKGHYETGLFTGGISRSSKFSRDSLESLENGRILLCFPQSGGSLESLKSLKALKPLNSLESLEYGLFLKIPLVQKTPFSEAETKCRLWGVY